ncbi:MAG TPA: DUF1697 domain-containing protein [Streptosporangiaceae bacterium]|nr:DUF1697 domain-containing protein [Streptosporangiaceae bacterium]
MRYAALLRGVNVGGRNKIAMAELRRILADLGCGDVVTLLQSGNAIFTSELPAATLEADISAAIEAEAGLSVAVMVRTGAELARATAAHPLGREPDNPARYFVAFLAAAPERAAADRFAALELEPEQAWVGDREAYLWCPNGAADTRLTGAFVEKQLGVAATARNWNTVGKLAALTAG